ncbi:MAG: hypothetical protein LBJ00_05950 [Planctomycetaceae bacterium]|nr:hypothetical protein [Planctomycetaceae bacterium]
MKRLCKGEAYNPCRLQYNRVLFPCPALPTTPTYNIEWLNRLSSCPSLILAGRILSR